ncbi:hypothetical protein AAHC03_01762 [Spirometra sp. Aus1]
MLWLILLSCCHPFALMVSSAMASPSPSLATFGIKLSYFENNLNFRLRSECCALSRPEICAEQCDLQFRFCFEDYQEEVLSTDSSAWSGQCQYGAANITFGRTQSQSPSSEDIITRVELMNPWPGAFTLILEAYRIQPPGGVLSMIDQTVYRHILLPTTSRVWRPLVISSPSSTYELAIQFQCSPNHYGHDCSRVCESVKDRFSCDPQGRKVCVAGWSGQDCDKPICRKGCHDIHGSCKTPGECKCSRGWTGENCDQCVKYPGCQKGVCDDAPFTCRCLPNWGGPFCDQDLDYCRRHKPCLHGGICQNTNATHPQFRCICPRGYRGERCEEKLDACALNPCKRGKCIPNNTHGFRCVCSAGWRGKYCEENIDFCDQNRCMNGGTCQDLDGEGFHCECPPGFEGSVCQRRSACSESRCVHARECTRMATTSNGIKHDCVCQAGWTGELCDHNIDDCTDKCKNGGQCRDLVGDYVCVCPEGFSGRNCEINHKCDVNPCKNDGVCVETDGGFKCICPEGVTGELCEVAKRGCDPNPCLNNAYCYDIEPNDYYCKCDANFYGRHCEHVRPFCGPLGCTRLLDPCSREHEFAAALIADLSSGSANASVLPTPVLPVTLNAQEVVIPKSVCGVHGICAKNDDGYGCVCETGYTGKYCEEVKDSCLDAPCLNGATCLSAGGKFQCLCREGFTGQFCEFEFHPCDEEPCYNGGYCQRTGSGTDFQCRCAPGWSGTWCHLPGTDPCAVSQPCRNNGICVTDAHSPTGYYCKCPFGWTGPTCQRRDSELQACANNSICANGGTCVDINGDAHCFCRPGFDGAHCEVNIDECRSNPCLNGGICHDLVNGFRCECQNGFMGPDCSYNIDDCATHPCAYGATCVDKIGGYECVCPEGRRGKHCEEVSSPSVPKPPSCRFNHRIYDHGQQWNYDCHRCECVKGKIVCEQTFCGYWSCLKAGGEGDPFACKEGETCHTVSTAAPRSACLTPPCYARAVCVNASLPLEPQLKTLTPPFLRPAFSGCRPNAAHLTNRCARIVLTMSRARLPYGVSVADVCNAVRALPVIRVLTGSRAEGGLIGLSCGLTAIQLDQEDVAAIELTLSSTDDRIRVSEEGNEYVFVQRFAQKVAADIRRSASTNLTSGYFEEREAEAEIGNHTFRMPSMATMTGADDQNYYWHLVLLGVVTIHVDTILVKDEDPGKPPLLVPLACCLILGIGLLCIVVICFCAHRKNRQLLQRYSQLKPLPPVDKSDSAAKRSERSLPTAYRGAAPTAQTYSSQSKDNRQRLPPSTLFTTSTHDYASVR